MSQPATTHPDDQAADQPIPRWELRVWFKTPGRPMRLRAEGTDELRAAIKSITERGYVAVQIRPMRPRPVTR